MQKILIFFLLGFVCCYSYSHVLTDENLTDTISVVDESRDTIFVNDNRIKLKPENFIVPSLLIGYGVGLYFMPALKDFDREIKEDIQKKTSIRTSIDDALLFVPFASVYALDLMGVPARHSLTDRLIVGAASMGMAYTAIEITKTITRRYRPDVSTENSFPSGHTAGAFAGAHLLMKEYGHISHWISVSGYTTAAFVGFLRITNNRHWFSDVIVGAGFGILSVELSYLLLPHISRTLKFENRKVKSSLTVSPVINNYGGGLGFSYRW